MLVVVCCLLFDVFCLLSVVYCVLCVVWSIGARCSVVRSRWLFVDCVLLVLCYSLVVFRGICYLLFVDWYYVLVTDVC